MTQIDRAFKVANHVLETFDWKENREHKNVYEKSNELYYAVQEYARKIFLYKRLETDTGLSRQNYDEIASFVWRVHFNYDKLEKGVLGERLSETEECPPKLSVFFDHKKNRLLTMEERRKKWQKKR